MNNIKLISTIFICIKLLNGCSFASKSVVNSQQNINQNKTDIENLPNGNYRYCSDPNPYPEDEPDVHRYCFSFTKTGNRVVGGYLYRAPKDTPYICIEGTAKDNLVTGAGYEDIGPSTQPYTEEDFSYLNELPENPPLSYWDDVEHYQGGLNLKVANPSLYKLSSFGDKYISYWATIRYENAQLYLNDFEQIKADSLQQYAECTNK